MAKNKSNAVSSHARLLTVRDNVKLFSCFLKTQCKLGNSRVQNSPY